MIITDHWSVTSPKRMRDYHIEFALTGFLDKAFADQLYGTTSATLVDWEKLKSLFTVYKNFDLGTPTGYGTWHFNTDPRDHSSNIEIAALCMGTDPATGVAASVTGPWGTWPYLKAHAWMHAGCNARAAILKKIDVAGQIPISSDPGILQNPPVWNLSTHGERAYQTQDEGQDSIPSAGYFAYSGDSQCRWDCAALDERDANMLSGLIPAEHVMQASAGWLRLQTHVIKMMDIDGSISKDMWGLDKSPT